MLIPGDWGDFRTSLTITDVFLDQNTVNVSEHTVKMVPCGDNDDDSLWKCSPNIQVTDVLCYKLIPISYYEGFLQFSCLAGI